MRHRRQNKHGHDRHSPVGPEKEVAVFVGKTEVLKVAFGHHLKKLKKSVEQGNKVINEQHATHTQEVE